MMNNDYSVIALHYPEKPYNPDDLRIYPIRNLTTGSRCELTLPVRIPYNGVVCDAGHPGWVVKGERRREGCFGPSWEDPIIILDGVDCLWTCDTIRASNKKDSNEYN